MRNGLGRRYFDTKIAEAKTRNEAMRCLKRRLANHLWWLMIADERRATENPDATNPDATDVVRLAEHRGTRGAVG